MVLVNGAEMGDGKRMGWAGTGGEQDANIDEVLSGRGED